MFYNVIELCSCVCFSQHVVHTGAPENRSRTAITWYTYAFKIMYTRNAYIRNEIRVVNIELLVRLFKRITRLRANIDNDGNGTHARYIRVCWRNGTVYTIRFAYYSFWINSTCALYVFAEPSRKLSNLYRRGHGYVTCVYAYARNNKTTCIETTIRFLHEVYKRYITHNTTYIPER